jgi:hypothetical protein
MSSEAGSHQYEMVAMEAGTAVASVKSPNRTSPDIKWTGLNFQAGSTKILSDCWGVVRVY